jgi:K+-sensing histidine kinase KdpD
MAGPYFSPENPVFPRATGGATLRVLIATEVRVRRVRSYRDAIAVVAGIALPIVVSAILVPFRGAFATTAAALVLVAVVVAVAANGSRLAGFVAAGSASLWFDFFLTQPYERFAMTHRPDIETAISLFVVGIAVTELAARNRHHHRVAVEETDYVGLVYYLAELVASGASSDQIIERAVAELTELLHLQECRYDSQHADHRVTSIDHDGNVNVGTLRWGAHNMGLPGKEVELLVQSRGINRGRFVLVPTSGWPVPLQRRLVAVAIADQVGAALTPHLRSA